MKRRTLHSIYHRLVEVWYDRRLKLWTAREIDVDGNQIDNADWHVDRDTLLLLTGARIAGGSK